jgi:transposase
VNAVAMRVALAVVARDGGVDATHRVVLVGDGAGWHTARTLVVPVGIALIRLPPASPELPPAEHLWSLLDEPVATRAVADLAAQDAVLEPRCRVLTADRATVQSPTHVHWWPKPIVQ